MPHVGREGAEIFGLLEAIGSAGLGFLSRKIRLKNN